jgi:PTS system beta-glucosides-specific IIC component
MDYKELAKQVVMLIGGKDNIENLTHCVTRLRFVLKDEKIAKTDEIRNTKGVLSVIQQGGQYQVVIGTEVKKAYDAVCKEIDVIEGDAEIKKEESEKKDTLFNTFFKTIIAIISPVLGVLGASGILKGILSLSTTFNLLVPTDGTYQILYAFADGFFYFLPIMLGFSACLKFKSNPYLGAAIGAALVYPNIVTAYSQQTGLTFLGIPVVLMSYTSSVFPIIIAAYIASKIERFFTEKLPTAFKSMFSPCLTAIIVVPLTFLVIGPIATYISSGLAALTSGLYNLSPLFTGIFLGAFWQVIVIFGLHYAFIPILINNIATMHQDPINAILSVTVYALAGMALGFGLKVKDKEKKAFGFSNCLTGLLGVTEPIIYGIALPYKRTFVCAFIGGGIGGAITASAGLMMYGFGGGGVLGAPMFLNPTGSNGHFIIYLVASAVAFVVSGVLAYLFGVKSDEK